MLECPWKNSSIPDRTIGRWIKKNLNLDVRKTYDKSVGTNPSTVQWSELGIKKLTKQYGVDFSEVETGFVKPIEIPITADELFPPEDKEKIVPTPIPIPSKERNGSVTKVKKAPVPKKEPTVDEMMAQFLGEPKLLLQALRLLGHLEGRVHQRAASLSRPQGVPRRSGRGH